MQNQPSEQACSCSCGHSTFAITAKPLFRFYCHCSICQSLYKKPFVDISAVWGKHVILPPNNDINFRKYRLPPAVNRGLCKACNNPVLGLLRLAPFVQMAFIQSSNISAQDSLPEPGAHIFYHSRVDDIDDAIPKHSGYFLNPCRVPRYQPTHDSDELI